MATTRFRVPDVTVLRSDQPRDAIITVPPLILIEVLSKDDSLRSMQERVDDYLHFGVEHIWILDPALRRAYICSATGISGAAVRRPRSPGNSNQARPREPFRPGGKSSLETLRAASSQSGNSSNRIACCAIAVSAPSRFVAAF